MSFTDFWGLIIEYFLNQEVREQEVTTLFPPPHPPPTLFFYLMPILFLDSGLEPSKSMFSKWFLTAFEAQRHTHSLAIEALTQATRVVAPRAAGPVCQSQKVQSS